MAIVKPASQTWRRFLENHVGCLASMDLFVVPTATFRLLYGFIIRRHDHRRIVHFGVTEQPPAIWIAQQITEAFPQFGGLHHRYERLAA